MEDWSWSHFASLQKHTTMHPRLRDEQIFSSWPDGFTRKTYTNGEFDHAVTRQEVFKLANRLSTFDLESVLIRPAILNQQVLALLVIGMSRTGGFPETVIAVTASVTAMTAMSLRSLELAQERDRMRRGLEDASRVSSALAKQSVDALTTVAVTHGMLAIRRPQEVARYSVALAEQLSIPKSDLYQLRLAALVADLGMIAIPSSILRKKTGFTPEEWKLIHSHPQMTVNMLKDFSLFTHALPLILHHHERWDGTGYPDQLKGASIPIGSRIIAIADAYVSMQTKRPYSEALTPAAALLEIQQKAGTQFDPELVKTFVRVLKAGPEESAAA